VLKNVFDGGFMYIHAPAKFIFSFAAMLYFSLLFGAVGVALGMLTLVIIFRFDKPPIRSQEEMNERGHVISATLFDSFSNILTVITLRLEKTMETTILARVADLWTPFRRNAMINEGKWFFADMLVGLTYAVIAVGYVYQHWEPGRVFYVGGLVTLLG